MAPSLGSSIKANDSVRPRLLLLVAAALLVLAPVVVSAESFDFEDLPVRTVVNAQYGARGVLFFGASIDNDPHARSGTRVIRSRPLNDEIFYRRAVCDDFHQPASARRYARQQSARCGRQRHPQGIQRLRRAAGAGWAETSSE